MANFILKLPDLGEGIVEAEIVEWHVKPGEHVEEDQNLCDVMTDKATVEIPAPQAGIIVAITGEPGDTLAVGTELLSMQVEDVAAPAAKPEIAVVAETVPVAEPAQETAASTPPPTPAASAPTSTIAPVRALASPAVRRRAAEAGIDLIQVPGTGPGGRITRDDFETFLAGGGRAVAGAGKVRLTGTQEIKLIGLRRKIAEKMALSARSIPHFTYVEEVDVTELEALRKHLNETRMPNQPKLTILPFLMLGLVKVVRDFPEVNATFDEEAGVITRYEAVHIGVAAQTDDGLKVPVVKHAEALDVWECAAEVVRLSQAARGNTAKMNELTGSSITITSLGALGGVVSTPVINHPEVAIIGVNRMQDKLVLEHGAVTRRLVMNLSSSFDHRIVDGYVAAQMIQAYKGLLEHPATLFM